MAEVEVDVSTSRWRGWATRRSDGKRVRVSLCACEKCGQVFINPDYADAHEALCCPTRTLVFSNPTPASETTKG